MSYLYEKVSFLYFLSDVAYINSMCICLKYLAFQHFLIHNHQAIRSSHWSVIASLIPTVQDLLLQLTIILLF